MKKVSCKKAFTLIELMVVMAVIGILATMMVPLVTSAINKARISKVVGLAKTLETACDAYYADMGGYANEFGMSGTTYSGPSYHNLAYNYYNWTNWVGPYIKKPLSSGDNPFASGGSIYVYSTIDPGGSCSPSGGGFDLNGDGAIDRSGLGNILCFNSVNQANAQKIDNIFDAGVPGNWTTTGRVQYGSSGGWVKIYLTGGV